MIRRAIAQAATACRQHSAVSSMLSRSQSTASAPAPKQKSDPDVLIRNIRRKEVAEVHNLWKKYGIDVGLKHMMSIEKYLCPDSYLVAIYEGRIVGGCINVNVNDEICMQGGLVVCPSAKGLGIARKVRFAGAKDIGSRNITCDAVPLMYDTYEGWGYIYRDYINLYFQGEISSKSLGSVEEGPKLDSGHKLVKQMDVDFRSVMQFDRTIHPISQRRECYMKWCFEQEDSKSYVILNNDNKVVALGGSSIIGGDDHFIGPVYADDPDHAEVIFRKLAADIPEGASTQMMAPQDNVRAVEMITKAGLAEVDQSLRMYCSKMDTYPIKNIFGKTVAGCAGLLPC